MASYVTQKERIRRIVLLVFLSVFVVGLGISLWYYIDQCDKREMGKQEIEEGEDESVKRSIKDFKREVRELEDVYEQREAAIIDFSEPVGWRIRASSTGDRYNHTIVYMRKIKQYLDEWVKTLQVGYRTRNETKAVSKYDVWESGKEEGVFLHVIDLIDELEKLHAEMLALEKRAQDEKAKAMAEEQETIKRTNESIKEKRNVIEGSDKAKLGGIIDDIIRELDNIVTALKNRNKEIAEQEEVFRTKTAELVKLKKSQQVEQLKRDAEVEVYRKKKDEVAKAHNIDLASENEKMEADAKVLFADNDGQVIWVDFTWKDRVFTGMVFGVYGINRGGDRVTKGRAKLIEIGDTMSKAVLEIDAGLRHDPVAVGDLLIEPWFINSDQNSFAFAGKLTGRLALEEIVHRLETKGDVHHRKAGTGTLFLVCGEGYETDPNYKAIEGLPIRTLRERDLYVYLGIPW